MKRRAFLAVGRGAATCALTARFVKGDWLKVTEELKPAPAGLEDRVAQVIQAYDGQGNHRTGTEVDQNSAEWLAGRVREIGVEPTFEAFSFSRLDPQSCYLRVANRRIDGVPLFDAGVTGGEGVHGRLGPLGSDAEIGLAESEPVRLSEPLIAQGNQVQEARRSRHQGVVVLTRGARPGLFLLNASSFTRPVGPPMLQISSSESDWLREQAGAHVEATLTSQVTRTAATAINVTAKVAGSRAALAPVVLMAPRSGWWACASEQGSRLACWLEAMRVLAAGKPARDCFFVALSGHELGLMGMDAYIQRRPALIKRAHVWIFFGSDIGAPGQPNLVHASDDVLERWAVAALEKEGLTVNAKARYDSSARGETSTVQRGGGRFITLACASQVYHNVADRWPEAVDVSILARYAQAFANGALELARQAA